MGQRTVGRVPFSVRICIYYILYRKSSFPPLSLAYLSPFHCFPHSSSSSPVSTAVASETRVRIHGSLRTPRHASNNSLSHFPPCQAHAPFNRRALRDHIFSHGSCSTTAPATFASFVYEGRRRGYRVIQKLRFPFYP